MRKEKRRGKREKNEKNGSTKGEKRKQRKIRKINIKFTEEKAVSNKMVRYKNEIENKKEKV